MFSSFYRSSFGFVIETRKFQGASISPLVVQSSRVFPLALQRRPSAHTFSGSLAGSPVLVCGAVARIAAFYPAPRYFYSGFTFVPEEVKHREAELPVTVGSRSSRLFFPPTVATCPAPRLMAVWPSAIAEGTPCPPKQVDRSSRASHEVCPGRSFLTSR